MAEKQKIEYTNMDLLDDKNTKTKLYLILYSIDYFLFNFNSLDLENQMYNQQFFTIDTADKETININNYYYGNVKAILETIRLHNNFFSIKKNIFLTKNQKDFLLYGSDLSKKLFFYIFSLKGLFKDHIYKINPTQTSDSNVNENLKETEEYSLKNNIYSFFISIFQEIQDAKKITIYPANSETESLEIQINKDNDNRETLRTHINNRIGIFNEIHTLVKNINVNISDQGKKINYSLLLKITPNNNTITVTREIKDIKKDNEKRKEYKKFLIDTAKIFIEENIITNNKILKSNFLKLIEAHNNDAKEANDNDKLI